MKQAEIWEIDLSPTIGAEIQKVRPAVIINDDAIGVLPLRVIVPIRGWKDQFQDAPWLDFGSSTRHIRKFISKERPQTCYYNHLKI